MVKYGWRILRPLSKICKSSQKWIRLACWKSTKNVAHRHLPDWIWQMGFESAFAHQSPHGSYASHTLDCHCEWNLFSHFATVSRDRTTNWTDETHQNLLESVTPFLDSFTQEEEEESHSKIKTEREMFSNYYLALHTVKILNSLHQIDKFKKKKKTSDSKMLSTSHTNASIPSHHLTNDNFGLQEKLKHHLDQKCQFITSLSSTRSPWQYCMCQHRRKETRDHQYHWIW